MRTLHLILELLKRLLDYLKNKRVQDESEKLKENPADWYNEHFDSDDRVQPDGSAPSDEASDNGDTGR